MAVDRDDRSTLVKKRNTTQLSSLGSLSLTFSLTFSPLLLDGRLQALDLRRIRRHHVIGYNF